jgi:hypothetical protein
VAAQQRVEQFVDRAVRNTLFDGQFANLIGPGDDQ